MEERSTLTREIGQSVGLLGLMAAMVSFWLGVGLLALHVLA